MNSAFLNELGLAVASLRASQAEILERLDCLSQLVENAQASAPKVEETRYAFRVERSSLSVHWRGKSCFLGNTLPFQVMERLARRPGQYIPTTDLLDELWEGLRAPSTVRSTVFQLRRRLVAAGMSDLARCIDGRTPGHYALLL